MRESHAFRTYRSTPLPEAVFINPPIPSLTTQDIA